MIDTLKEIILDFQKDTPFTGVKRHLDYEIVPNKVFICIGVRRCGKTTLLHQIIEKLQKNGTLRKENIVYINFFDDRLTELRTGNLQPILDAYFTLFPEKKASETVYFFFDEIQEVENYELFIERILRTETCRIFLSGSSAKLLSKDIATQLRGRSLSWELFPFSFREFLDFKGFTYGRMDSKTKYGLQKYFEEYFEKGGFPEVVESSKKIRLAIHQEYYKSILHRDIIERYDLAHPQALIQIGYRLMTSISNLYTINKLTEYIKSFGYKVPKSFVSDSIEWLEDAYLLFTVKLYSRSVNVQNTNPKKIYCIDHGLVRSITPAIQQKEGYILENIVFIYLRNQFQEIYYYKTGTGSEIDFLYVMEDGRRGLLQVCYAMDNNATEGREVGSLFDAMNELRLEKGIIITYRGEREIERGKKKIRIVPAWRFLCEDIR